jgi:hypothetical protein
MSSEFMAINVPTNMTVRKNSNHLQITRRWFDISYVFFTPVVIAYDVFGFPYFFRLQIMAFSASKIDVESILPLLILVSLVIASNYALMIVFINTTTISVTSNTISVKHGPLPHWGSKRLASKEVLQLWCKKEKFWNPLYGGTTYTVEVVMNDKSIIILLFNLIRADQALFIKQEIEKFLNIEDKPVKGEFK